jgi:hypothetical protein
MIFKRLNNPLIYIGLGSVIVIVTAVLVIEAPKRAGVTAQAEPAAGSPAVRGDDLDSARRFDRADDEAPAAAPATTPEPAADAPRTREPMDGPATISDEVKAEMDAYAALQKKVAAEVEGQLRGQRSALAAACSGVPGSGDAAFFVNATFDADGRLVESGIGVPAEAAGSRELGQCLRGQKLALSASPPGQSVSVQVPLEL